MTKALATASVLAISSLLAAPAAPAPPTDAERARWTMADMRSLATALEAYAKDHHTYPGGTDLAAVLPTIEPSYIRKAPARDAWGHPFVYVPSSDGGGYRLASAGADGTTQPETWAVTGPLDDFAADAVVDSGSFVRPWPLR